MSIFSEHWRNCLKEHYKTVVRANDTTTLKSLVGVMYDVGFREDELRLLQVQATLHVDDVGPDFVPDLDILAESASAAPAQDQPEAFAPHPLECQCPACVEITMKPHDADGQPLPADALDSEANPGAAAAKLRKDPPKQLSLF